MDEATLLTASQAAALHDDMVAALRTCYDPEIPVNIYDLGLIYQATVDTSGHALVKMTLTAPGCPAAGWLAGEVEDKITALPGIKSVQVDVVWDPPWSKEMMSEAAKLQLGFL
jgi:FeS assembly SUF system protein